MSNFLDSIQQMMGREAMTPDKVTIRNVDHILEKVDDRWHMANERVRGLFGPTYFIDEMALYFASDEALFGFMARALRRGWVAFNQAEDEVTTLPIESAYSVSYWFLGNEKLDYRLELMRVHSGFSPYHGSLADACAHGRQAAVMAHASFKVPDEQTYASVGVALRKNGFEVMQHCSSSYGRFSYYNNNDKEGMPAIKPRINIRDAKNNA